MKKNMKNIAASIALIVAGVTMLCGCSVSKTSFSKDQAVEDTVVAEEEKAAAIAEDSQYLDSFTYSKMVEGEGYYDSFENRYTIDLLDDQNATLYDECVYSDTRRYISEYSGTYVRNDNSIRFEYEASDESESYMAYVFELDGETVTDVVSDNSGQSTLAGVYSCQSEQYGDLSLAITNSGKSTLTVNGKEYPATLDLLSDRWNLMVYDMEEDFSIDWYVDFNGDSFTYEAYGYTDYSLYAGELDINGDLGVIHLVLTDSGEVTANCTIDGQKIELTGNYYIDEEARKINYINLYSEGSYSMDLYIEDIGEEMFNYSGSVTRTLGAG